MAFNLNPEMLAAISQGLLSGQTGSQQLGNAMTGALQARQGIQQRNKTMEFLAQSPEISQMVQAGVISPQDGLKAYLQQQAETRKAQDPVNRYKAVGGSLYDVQSGDWISPPAGAPGTEEWGLSPVWGKDASGKTVLGQISKTGRFKPLDTGDFTPTPGISNIDAGTSVISRNSRTGEVMAQTPKDLAGAEEQKAIGDARGKSRASAAGDFQAAQNALSLVQDLKTDPNRQWGTGKTSMGNRIPASPGYDYQNKVDQAKAGAFATAIQQMRGLGALSNAEGDVATRAVTRMDTATSEEAFMDALDDYEKIIRQGMERAARLMDQGGQQQPAQGGGNRTATGVQWSID